MTVIADVSKELSQKQLDRFEKRIAHFEEMIAQADSFLELDGVLLEQVAKNHPGSQALFERMLQECKTIQDLIEIKVNQVKGIKWKALVDGSPRALAQKDIEMLISGDPEYVQIQELLLEIVHVRRQLEAICKALDSLGWAISNITKLRIAQLEKIVL